MHVCLFLLFDGSLRMSLVRSFCLRLECSIAILCSLLSMFRGFDFNVCDTLKFCVFYDLSNSNVTFSHGKHLTNLMLVFVMNSLIQKLRCVAFILFITPLKMIIIIRIVVAIGTVSGCLSKSSQKQVLDALSQVNWLIK